jgi:hypothetical protein
MIGLPCSICAHLGLIWMLLNHLPAQISETHFSGATRDRGPRPSYLSEDAYTYTNIYSASQCPPLVVRSSFNGTRCYRTFS